MVGATIDRVGFVRKIPCDLAALCTHLALLASPCDVVAERPHSFAGDIDFT